MPTRRFALIGFQRSGTHLLREILNSNPHVALLAEPFSPHSKPVQWCNFVRKLPRLEYPPVDTEAGLAILDEFMDGIARDVRIEPEWYGGAKPQLKSLGLDIKYNQLRCVTSLAADLRSRPMLVEYFQSRQFGILHIVRKNIVHAAVSLIVASMRNVWHNYDGVVVRGPFEISWNWLYCILKTIEGERDEFVRLVEGLEVHTLFYEDLVKDLQRVDKTGQFPEESITFSPLAAFLGVPNRFIYDGKMFKVINRPYAEILQNFDEIVAALRNSEFAQFADSLDNAEDQSGSFTNLQAA